MKVALFYDHVTVLDYAYLDDHQGLVGNSLMVDVEFIGETDDEGVVFDFSYAKKKVKEIIDRECDHRLVIPKNLAKYEAGLVQFEYKYGYQDLSLKYIAPAEAVCEIPSAYVSEANLQAHLEELVMKEMPNNVSAIKLKLREEKLSTGDQFFNYTHGLKEHYGNCQRLMHGHRSTLEVYTNNERRHDIEKELIQNQFSGNIHFCFWENVENKNEIQKLTGEKNPIGRFKNLPPVYIKYSGNQGLFQGWLPGNSIYFMATETTVENLSIHFCQLVKSVQNDPLCTVKVRAFEGVGKGSQTTI
ncbi:MAG: 6-carboxytetrahydropterin synthase [Bacteriovoracaceae bacterium]|nr:6-carboxytetrahydropterin synthase [Bacteriovoracaceae bacterium]